MNGSDWIKRTSRTRLTPSVKTKRLWLGMRTTLCTVARVPTVCRSVGFGRVQARIQLRGDHNRPLLAQRFNQLDGAFPADRQRQHGVGKQNRVANRQNRNPARSRVRSWVWIRSRV